jgi:ABC-2 type transport system permease protein
VISLFRASWLTATSYRLGMVITFVSLVVSTIPIFFVSRALQPLMGPKVAAQGGEYFAFLLLGIVAFTVLNSAVTAPSSAIASGIQTGTLEALLATPAPLTSLLAGLVSYELVWSTIRALAMLVVGLILGMKVSPTHALAAMFILALTVAAYLAIGVIASAMIVAFRTSGPLVTGVLLSSALLGGVYWPTTSLPASWLQYLAAIVPLTYGARAMRQTLLAGVPLTGVATDVLALVGFVIVFMAAAAVAMHLALQYARRSGTLAQY